MNADSLCCNEELNVKNIKSDVITVLACKIESSCCTSDIGWSGSVNETLESCLISLQTSQPAIVWKPAANKVETGINVADNYAAVGVALDEAKL